MLNNTSFPFDENDLFQSAFNYASIGMALVGTDGTWLEVNDSVCRITGYSKAELLKLTFQDLTHPDDLEKDLTFLEQLLAGDINSYEMEKRYFHKLGHIVWALLTVSLVRNEDQEPLFFISQIQDITERKAIEGELRDRTRELKSVLNNTNSVISRMDREYRYLYVNSAVEQEIGISASEMIGKKVTELGYSEQNVNSIKKTIETVFDTKQALDVELVNDMVPEERFFLCHFTPEFNQDGEVETALAIALNITEAKNTENALRNALAEIKQLKKILPICSYCKNIRDDNENWTTVENYISSNTDSNFTHSVCPDCYDSEVKPQLKKLKKKKKT